MSRKKNSVKKNEVAPIEPTVETIEALEAIGETVDVGDVEIVQSDAELEAIAELDTQSEIKLIEAATQEIAEILKDEQPEVIPTDTIGDMMPVESSSTDADYDLSDLTFGDAVPLDADEVVSGIEEHAPDVMTLLGEPLEAIEQNVADPEPTEEIADLTLDAEMKALEQMDRDIVAVEAREAFEALAIEDGADFDTLLAGVTDDEADAMTKRLMETLDDRATFERQKNPNNETVQNSIKSARRMLAGRSQGRLLVACGFNESELMRERHAGSKYNVYAYKKLGDIVQGLAVEGGKISNAVNIACMKSLFRCRRAGVTFDKKVAEACVSKSIHVEAAIAKHLVRHTASAITASTQASSTMQALQTLGVVSASGSRNPTFTVTGSPLAKKLEGLLAA